MSTPEQARPDWADREANKLLRCSKQEACRVETGIGWVHDLNCPRSCAPQVAAALRDERREAEKRGREQAAACADRMDESGVAFAIRVLPTTEAKS
jgi:hypothetical protein